MNGTADGAPGSDADSDAGSSDDATADDPEDPTAGIDFDSVAATSDPEDPTAGIDFDAVAAPAADDTDAIEGYLAGLSEEADADTIDAIFNS